MRILTITQLSVAKRCNPSHPLKSLFVMLLLAFLSQASALAFHIECPPDVTVECNDELWDLSIYGNATVYGYGSPQSAGDPEWVEYNLNSCNAGTIVRTWVAYDYSGTQYTCSQTIYVSGGGNIHITWPPDYIIHDCLPGGTDPDDLPPPYDYPVVQDYGAECASVMYNYEDQVFDINPPACTKILRKWTVIDWCSYNPNDWHPTGIWHHTQIIKIVPESPPVINCPEDVTASSGFDCSWTYVSIPPATGMSDCSANVIISNLSPYADSNGADASGNYPPGVTWVTFKAEDGCGGYVTCKMKVTVMDLKKPTPICYYGISISLMQMPDGYYMDLRPEFFDKGSFDNCTPKHKLTFDIEPKRVDCDDIGQVPVKMYVSDEFGNTAFCNTVVYVQDNMGMCPPTQGDLTGSIGTSEGLSLEHVKVELQGTSMFRMTDDDGKFTFNNMPYGSSYVVKPTMESHDLQGITTLDLLYFVRHIMGVESFTSPYQYIAADMNNSANVTANDMIALRDKILRNLYQAPTESGWKFIDANHQFSDPFNPFNGGIPETYTISNLNGDMSNLNFTGIKLGDLSGDAMDENGFTDDEVRGAAVKLLASQASVKAGEEFEVKIHGKKFTDLVGYQFTLRFDNEQAEFISLDHGSLKALDQNNFGFSGIEDGLIAANWFSLDPAGKEKVSVVSLRFKALKSLKVEDILSLSDEILSVEAYTSDLVRIPMKLEFTKSTITPPSGTEDEFEPLPQLGEAVAYPNPFNTSTSIGFNLNEKSDVTLVVYDINGKQLHEISRFFNPGYHEVAIQRRDLGTASGIFFCDLISATDKKTIKLMILDKP